MVSKARWVVGAIGAMWAVAAPAAGPAAIVEEVSAGVVGVEFMDYVAAGRVIALGANGRLALGYLKSCARERIVGGTVTVGDLQSTVSGGDLRRSRVACDGAQAAPSKRDATQSAATVFRSLRSDTPPASVYARSPLIDVGSRRGTLRIERIDPVGEPLEIAIDSAALVAGRFVDLAAAKVELVPAATYVARLGANAVVFRVDSDARPDAAGAVGRLLRFE